MLGHEARRVGVDRLAARRAAAAREHLRDLEPRHRPALDARRRTRSPSSSWSRSRGRSVVDAKVLILDEPTSSLDADEVAAAVRA